MPANWKEHMNPAVFIDANIPIYAAGRDHPYKEPCSRILRMVVHEPEAFVTDSEVLQELLHRYLALGRWALGREVVQALAEIMQGLIEPVHAEDVMRAIGLADRYTGVSARDLVHAAVMHRLGSDHIISADTDFERLEGIVRLDPARIDEWADFVLAVPKD